MSIVNNRVLKAYKRREKIEELKTKIKIRYVSNKLRKRFKRYGYTFLVYFNDFKYDYRETRRIFDILKSSGELDYIENNGEIKVTLINKNQYRQRFFEEENSDFSKNYQEQPKIINNNNTEAVSPKVVSADDQKTKTNNNNVIKNQSSIESDILKF